VNRRALAVVVLVALAGCSGSLLGPETTPDERTATVVHVVDGDTLDVRFADGSEDRSACSASTPRRSTRA